MKWAQWKIIKNFLHYLKPFWFKQVIMFLLVLVTNISALANPYFLKILIDEVLPQKDLQLLIYLLLVFFAVNLVNFITTFFLNYYFEWLSNNVLLNIRTDLFSHLLRLPMRFYDNNKVGDILHRMSSEVNTIQTFITGSMLRLINNVLGILIISVILTTLNFKLFFISLIVGPAILFNTVFFQKRIHGTIKKSREGNALVFNHLTDRFSNIGLVKGYEQYDYEIFSIRKLINRVIHFNIKSIKYISFAQGISALLISLSIMIIFWYGGKLVISDVLTVGTLVVFIQYFYRIFNPFKDLMGLYYDATRAFVSMGRVFEFFNIEKEEDKGNKQFQIKNKISFQNLSFGYNDKNEVLKELDLDLYKGKTYALVGSSGSGKSTIGKLLFRYYDANKGDILIDDIKIQDISLSGLRKKIVYVSNQNRLFSSSIMENILYGNLDSTSLNIEKTTKIVGVFNDICKLENKFDTHVGNNGSNLSEGQGQRISIARALLKNADIIILDESTSGVDAENEKDMYKNILMNFDKEKIIIIISHRLSTVSIAEEIIYLENGKIEEKGSHEELFEKKGKYYFLFHEQFLKVQRS